MTGDLSLVVGFLIPRSRSLESQRADFTAVLAPLRDEQASLRDRIAKLESQHEADVKQHYLDVRRIDILVDHVRDLRAFIAQYVPSPPPPPIPPEISQDI
ncbi:hypothetical protein ACFO5K_04675 [Nocardia halotolerans]|uniref:Uncharacterized protein n=1 Tax=Nocardia halotolerans TaxID=1755878 RepID=A0ABV8VF83_9NOCA